MTQPDDPLPALLGVDPPASVAQLDPSARAELAELVRAARAEQARSLDQAFAATVRHVPFPVRGIVKKILLG